jgi:beta-lactamase regulating signal transducer with metallopeptidase domain
MTMPILHGLPSVSVVAAEFLVASIWQGLVVVGCVAVLLRVLPGLTAAVRSVIWTAVLLLVVAGPAVSVGLREGSGSAAGRVALVHVSETWSLMLVAVWAAVSLVRVVQLMGSAVRLQSLAQSARAVDPSEALARILRGNGRRVELCLSDEIDRPSVVGFFRPRILIAPELFASLSAAELEQVVLHEVEHVRRYDDWTNLLQKLSLALVPLHPVLLWVDRRMCLERELACDDRVMRQTRARKAYAACLTRLAEESLLRRGLSLALGALGSLGRESELAGRVRRILQSPEKSLSRGRIWVTTAVVLLGAFAGVAELSRSPELIHFTGAAQHDTATPVLAGVDLGRTSLQPVRSFQGRPAQPMLVKAVMPQRPQSSFKAVVVRQDKRQLSGRSLVQRAPVPQRAYVALTEWRSVGRSTSISETEDVPATFVSVTQVQPVFYAAVPTRDGWLLIQL